MSTVKHYHHHYHFSYTTSLSRHFISIGLVLAFLMIILFWALGKAAPSHQINLDQLSPLNLLVASFNTFFRLTIAYLLALAISVPLALLITLNPKVEKMLLPFFDILQSIPVLAFFPIIVLAFIKINYFDGAAIFILFMAMLWNLVFNMIGGIKTIPENIKFTAQVFGAKGWKKLWYVILPSILPYIITGSLLSWAQGWNIVIVAEALHTYIPNGSPAQDLFGLGTLLVSAIAQGKNSVFLAALTIMILVIGSMNFFIWQKLLHRAERYKYD